MSEYQYVGFRAVDAPLSDSQLEYMRRQSTRAEITRRSFDNEYHFGDFHGNTVQMLRRGYDVHLLYANFGVRTVMFRLPLGMPAAKTVWHEYLRGESVTWKPDPKGPAGILALYVTTEPETLDEIWNVSEYLDRLVGVRQQLIDGDLRPLYAAWLCGCQSDEVDGDSAMEPPVPAGLRKLSDPLAAMLEFFSVSRFTLAAAAESASMHAERSDRNTAMSQWLNSVKPERLRKWVLGFLNDDAQLVRNECVEAFRKASPIPAWPVTQGTRTYRDLLQRAEELEAAETFKKEQRQQQALRKRRADMAKSPQKYLGEATRHVALGGRDHYRKAALILSELREVVGGEEGDRIVRQHAAHLKKKNPTLKMLISALRRENLLP